MSSSVTDMKPISSLGSRVFLAIRRNIQTYTLIIAVIAIWAIFFFATGGSYLGPQNISNLFRQMSVTSFLSIGMVLVIVTGGIDLSVGKLAGFCSVVCGLYYCLPGVAGLYRNPGWYVAFQRSTPVGYCRENHCGWRGDV
jgi:ABC-type xylose transport system permease subunit